MARAESLNQPYRKISDFLMCEQALVALETFLFSQITAWGPLPLVNPPSQHPELKLGWHLLHETEIAGLLWFRNETQAFACK